MHILTFQTRFTFGDKVRFDSAAQQRNGEGEIVAITIDRWGEVDYCIALTPAGSDGLEIQPGVLDSEIFLL